MCWLPNVHCDVLAAASALGNSVAIGVILREEHGKKVWGAHGPMNHLTEEQAIMAGIQAALVHAKEKKWDLVLIETTNRDIFDLISDQDQFIIPEELLEAFRVFNSLHANHHVLAQAPASRKISLIPDHMNYVAVYLADYGLHHLSEFVEMPGDASVGNLQFLLNQDMGLVFADPGFEMVQHMGLGEVDNAEPPPRPLTRKRKHGVLCEECGSVMGKQPSTRVSPFLDPFMPSRAFKGKNTGYESFAFYDNGVLSQSVIVALESGALLRFSPAFGETELNLEAHVKNGLCVKHILHHACLGTLGLLEYMLEDSFDHVLAGEYGIELMPFDQVEAAMDFGDAVVPVLDESGLGVNALFSVGDAVVPVLDDTGLDVNALLSVGADAVKAVSETRVFNP
ncbi:hypothetical protein DCAR_0623467 [Daucus carota subsp. sativus]|uniref:Uncharacterized protein n=1 Tax=Daucus carota subsp. sativus TaxID=79200 RepID=A0A175YBJ8_DAUCS|nr:hypothetical protein DCAR_0623467 [Daucus carota subsp. sativus]